MPIFLPGILGFAVILYLFGSVRVLRQYERGVVFLLGKFEGVRGAGLTLIFAPIQQMVRVSLRTVTMQFPRKISSPRTTFRSTSRRSLTNEVSATPCTDREAERAPSSGVAETLMHETAVRESGYGDLATTVAAGER